MRRQITRRHFLGQTGFGLGSIALCDLLGRNGYAGTSTAPATGKPHFPPRARSVIFLFMVGAPSPLDLFDHKPRLNQLHGQPCPESLIKGERFAFIKGRPHLLGSPFAFRRHGQSGQDVSELLPHTASVADKLAVVRSMRTTQFNHAPAQIFMHTGHQLVGRPSMGAWLSYGLGSENQDLPAFVALVSNKGPDGGKSCWGSGYLPSHFQGAELRSSGDPVLFLSNPRGITPDVRRSTLDAMGALNRVHLAETGDPEIRTRIAAYEMAYRMQSSVPELMDVAREPAAVHQMYGTEPGKPSFANNCLLARRLVERGVRFVELYHAGWDHHGSNQSEDLLTALPRRCREIDQPAAALIRDLEQRGLLDSTLVIWGGEFGRTPMNEERGKFLGRDHNPKAFTMWLAGGGIKPGLRLGETDEFGNSVVQDPVHVHDLHATILHLMGLDHTRLTFRFQGRDYRLTDVEGNVVQKLLA